MNDSLRQFVTNNQHRDYKVNGAECKLNLPSTWQEFITKVCNYKSDSCILVRLKYHHYLRVWDEESYQALLVEIGKEELDPASEYEVTYESNLQSATEG